MEHITCVEIDGLVFQLSRDRVFYPETFSYWNSKHEAALKKAEGLQRIYRVYLEVVRHGKPLDIIYRWCSPCEMGEVVDGFKRIMFDLRSMTPHFIRLCAAGFSLFAERSQKQIQDRPGYVYLLSHATIAHVYKIGRSKRPDSRAYTFGVQLPFSVEMSYTHKCSDMFAAEAELHRLFAHKRLDGEWFFLDELEVAYLKAHNDHVWGNT
jgi:hypothetical protein